MVSPGALNKLYFALVQFSITYCINVYGSANKTMLKPLILKQKKAIRIISRANFRDHSRLGLAISDKKLFLGKWNRQNSCFVSGEFRLFRGTENFRNSVPNHSTEEKNARPGLPWNKNRNNLSEFCSAQIARIFFINPRSACRETKKGGEGERDTVRAVKGVTRSA